MTETVKSLPAMQETSVQPIGRQDPWRREWLPTPVFLSGESHEQSRLLGYSSWGCKELDMTEQLNTKRFASRFMYVHILYLFFY